MIIQKVGVFVRCLKEIGNAGDNIFIANPFENVGTLPFQCSVNRGGDYFREFLRHKKVVDPIANFDISLDIRNSN